MRNQLCALSSVKQRQNDLAPSGVSLRYDSLTGVPSCQRTLAFEKGSVLFNIGALYTQIGARQDRSAAAGIDKAVDAFQRAAGTQTCFTLKPAELVHMIFK